MSNIATTNKHSPFAVMASRLSLDEEATRGIMIQALMKAKGGNGQVSNEELVTFLSIANEYQLNPLTKEIYAFNNRGAIQPIVSIDGWLKIINSHKQFNGMEFVDNTDSNGGLVSVTCKIHRKDREHPTEVTEYMSECKGTSEPWKKWPARMLRHKAAIQGARYAFGLSGIIDPDEAERYESVKVIDGSHEIEVQALPAYDAKRFEANFAKYSKAIADGQKTADDIIAAISTRYLMSEEQKNAYLEFEEDVLTQKESE